MSNTKTIYVCYEENTNGPVVEMFVASTTDEMFSWVDKRLKFGKENCFVPCYAEDIICFFDSLNRGENTELELYLNGEEDLDYYSLVVRMFSVNFPMSSNPEKSGFSPKINDNVHRSLENVQADIQKSEKFAEAFVDSFKTDDEDNKRRGYYMAKAILDGNIDDLLIAICGYSTQSLINIAEYGTPYSE